MTKSRYEKTHKKYVGRIRLITNRNEIIRHWVIKGDLSAAMDLVKKQMRDLLWLRKNYANQFAAYRLRTVTKEGGRSKRKAAKKK